MRNDAIAGTSGVLCMKTRHGHDACDETQCEHLALAPSTRCSGIGRRELVDMLEGKKKGGRAEVQDGSGQRFLGCTLRWLCLGVDLCGGGMQPSWCRNFAVCMVVRSIRRPEFSLFAWWYAAFEVPKFRGLRGGTQHSWSRIFTIYVVVRNGRSVTRCS